METLTITKQQARRFILAHQGLRLPCELEGKAGVCSQLDEAAFATAWTEGRAMTLE